MRIMGRIPNSQHASLKAKIKAPAIIILTLSFEFPNNYSQKRVLWRNMPPPNRHGSPLIKIVIKKIFGRPSESKALLRQVLAGVNQNRRDSPFSLSPVSHPRRKIEPLLLLLLLPDPPCFPYFNSDASPVERIAEASMRSSPTPSRKKRSRQPAVSPTFHRRSSKAPCVCAVLLLRGED